MHVKVNNNLFGAVAPTIHWHGFKMSEGYYWLVISILIAENLSTSFWDRHRARCLGKSKILGGDVAFLGMMALLE